MNIDELFKIAKALEEARIKNKFTKKLEPVIAKDPSWAFWYARDVLEDSFPLGEPAIATDPQWAYEYARDVLKDPDPETWAERYLKSRN